MTFRDLEDRRLKTCEDAIGRLQRYSESKNDDMFDILYNSHINVITQLLSIEINEILDNRKIREEEKEIAAIMAELIEYLDNKYINAKFKLRIDDDVTLVHNNKDFVNNDKFIDEVVNKLWEKAEANNLIDKFMDKFCVKYERQFD